MNTAGVGLLAVLTLTEAVSAHAAPACRSTLDIKDYMDRGGSLVHANKEPAYESPPNCGRIACLGAIDFSFLIDERGRVSNVSIVKNTWEVDSEYYASVVMSHVAKMRYAPPKLKERSVCVLGKLHYVMQEDAGK